MAAKKKEKKKILFLMMVYDNGLLMKEYDILMKHYYKMKKKHKLDNIEIYGYTSGKEVGYDADKHLFTFVCSGEESNLLTYEKTKRMFAYALDNKEFDFVYRTNTSTFTNILLLDKLVQETNIADDDVYCSDIYVRLNDERNIQEIYGRGNSILYPRALVKKIAQSDIQSPEQIGLTADDDTIGVILAEGTKYHQYWCEWFMCAPNENELWGNMDYSLGNLGRQIAIQCRNYFKRELEPIFLSYLANVFENEYKCNKKYLTQLTKELDRPVCVWVTSLNIDIHNEVNGYYTIDPQTGQFQRHGYDIKEIKAIKYGE